MNANDYTLPISSAPYSNGAVLWSSEPSVPAGPIGGSYSPPFAEIAFAIVGLREIL
jgi:hypothetical protein